MTFRELLAIVKTLEHLQKYLYGQEFHTGLTCLLSFRNLQEKTARWVQRLQGYNFTSEYRHGIKHKRYAVSGPPCFQECSHCQRLYKRQTSKRFE